MYKLPENRVSIWAESYGGHWGPGVASFIEQQNDKIASGTLNATMIHLDTVGIINGGIDFLVTASSYPGMAYNNTYGFQAITDSQYESAKTNLTTCTALVYVCQEVAGIYDPENSGNNASVNTACLSAYEYCYLNVEAAFLESGVILLLRKNALKANIGGSTTLLI